MNKARELTKVAAESQGMAELKYQAYMESSEAATKRLQNAWEGLTNSFRTSNVLTGIRKTIAWVVENLTTVASTLGSILLSLKAMRSVNLNNLTGRGLFGGIGSSIRDRTVGLLNSIKGYTEGNETTRFFNTVTSSLKDLVATTHRIAGDKVTGAVTSGSSNFNSGYEKIDGKWYYKEKDRKGNIVKRQIRGHAADVLEYNELKRIVGSGPNYSTNNKEAYFDEEKGAWFYSKTGNKITSKARIEELEGQRNKYQEASGKLLKYQKLERKGGSLGHRIKMGATAGLMTGAMQGLSYGATFKNSDGEEASTGAKVVAGATMGLTTAVTTGLMTAIPYIGPVVGPVLGPMLGTFIGDKIAPILGNLIDQQAIARRERSKDAEKTYNTLKSINNDTEKLKSLSQKSTWNYDDYQQAATTVDAIIKQMFSNPKAARALAPSMLSSVGISGLSDAALVEKLAIQFRSQYLSVSATEQDRQKLVSEWEKALAKEMAIQYEASQEANIYKYNETLHNPTVKGMGAKSAVKRFASETGAGIVVNGNSVTFTDTKVEDRLLTEQKLLNYLQAQGEETSGFYKALQKSIADLNSTISDLTDMTESINKERLNAAVISSGILNYSSTQIKEKGKDIIAQEILNALNNMENGGFYINSSNSNYKAQWNGSYNNLGETAKNYLSNYFRGNQNLLGLLTQESYTLNDVLVKGLLGDLDSVEALTFLNKFSKSLGTTVSQLENYIDKYGDFTLGDLLLGDSDIFAKIDSLNEILNNIASATGLTAQNMMDIISKYPQYIKYLGDTSALTKAISSDVESWIQLQTQGFAQAINENIKIYDNIFDKIKERFQDSEFYSWFIEGENFGEVKNLGNFFDRYFSLTDKEKEEYVSQFEEIDKMISEEYGSFQANFTTKYIDIAKDYYGKLYEMQISNLEAQKSALENINSQREYENKLVEARLKLENAQNEKQMVYREGVGFVYEADQEAIQEAQKELDQLETEKLTDTLQMQIEELQSQKKWLDEYAERNQFKAMAEAVKGLTEKDGPLATLNSTGQDLKTAADNILQAYANINNVDVEDLKKPRALENKDQVDLASKQLLESGKAVLSGKQRLQLAQRAARGDKESLNLLLNSDSQFNSDYNAASSSLEKQKVLANYVQSARDSYNSSVGDFQSSYANAQQLGMDLENFDLGNGITAYLMNKGTGEGGDYAIDSGESTYNRPNIPFGILDVATEEANAGLTEKLKNSGWNKRVYIARVKKGGQENQYMIGLDTEDMSEAKSIITRMLGNRFPGATLESVEKTGYLSNTSGGANRGDELVREYFNNDFRYNVNPSALKTASLLLESYFYNDASKAGSGYGRMTYDRILFDDGDDGDKQTSDVVSIEGLTNAVKQLISYEGNDDVFGSLFPKDKNARGSLYTRGGLSSISELGPELFVTPGLSGTALIPEGSKVLPADATKGLWELGGFAAEFIKPLRSLMSGFGNGDSTVFGADESTNINTLNITLRADKDFDADKFIQQLKLLQAISKNNA